MSANSKLSESKDFFLGHPGHPGHLRWYSMGLKVGQLPEDVVISRHLGVISEICIDWVWSFWWAKDWWQDSLVRHPVAWHESNNGFVLQNVGSRYPLWGSLCLSWEINEFDISCIQVGWHFQQTQKRNSPRKAPRSPRSPKVPKVPKAELNSAGIPWWSCSSCPAWSGS